ncbi:MAG: hypothetical protein IPM29_06160 [Planctomycetes bacterium]|nr:hypothetical protein [Planctomycetota bacterium]
MVPYRAWPPLLAALLATTALPAQGLPVARPFRLQVVDAATGRGVPLVELETVHHVRFVTDSNGLCAIAEPELLGRRVYFHVHCHGYAWPTDGFGFRGFACDVTAGGERVVRIERTQIAERLYRVTGAGIYRDTVLLGERAPIAEPLLNGGVLGCDSVVNAIYLGRLWWFWGDTNRAAYPLGNFAVSGATSRLPADGGLPPATGVDLDYFTGPDGFARRCCPIDGPGPVWVFGPMVVTDAGRERLLCHYERVKDLEVRYEHGIAEWNDDAARFEKLVEFPLDAPLYPHGNPLRVRSADGEWFVFGGPYPVSRVRTSRAAILDPGSYEAFTCLPTGARDSGDQTVSGSEPVRDADGSLQWEWRTDAPTMSPERAQRTPGAEWMTLRDVETGAPIRVHRGTLFWNAHRRRYVAIALEALGRSMLGEVWFAEADTPLGPFGYARRIVTHDSYSFYNVKQHPYFDEDGGRLVYFEGTYTTTFSGNPVPTPRYDYNQVMCRIDLDDPRLDLPVPVYRVREGAARRWLTRPAVAARGAWAAVESVPFWALPPARSDSGEHFRTLPVTATDAPETVALYRWTRAAEIAFVIDGEAAPGPGLVRDPDPVGRVWRAPTARPPLWPDAEPVDR